MQRDPVGHILMDTLPLDVNSIVSEELTKEERRNPKSFSSGAKIGHIHLRVTDLERSVKFYHEKLGLEVTLNLVSMGAAFLSAGGYHHHIGLNTWNSLNGKPRTQDEAGLGYFTITTPSINTIKSLVYDSATPEQQKKLKSEVNENQLLINDPDGIGILIKKSE
ncbi:MAG: VOC family protein [Candidatus Nitrosopolaris sp.]